MMSKFKAAGWSILSCAILSGFNLQAYEYGYFEMPNVVQPIYLGVCDPSPFCAGWDAPIRLTLSHTEGKWFDVKDGYTSFNGFVALGLGYRDSVIPFVDLRGHVFNNGKGAVNFGGGLRYAIKDSKNIVGFNVFYDYRNTKRDHNFNQIGFGLEFLSPCADLRLNFYFPVGSTIEKGRLHVFEFNGPFCATCQQVRHALSGGDIELGGWLIPRSPCGFFNLYGTIAPYYYVSRNHHHSHNSNNEVYGISGRFLTLIGDYFSLEMRAGYDRSYKGMVQWTFAFEIPLDKLFEWNSWFESDCWFKPNCRAYQPVVRQEMIVLDHKRCCWHSNF